MSWVAVGIAGMSVASQAVGSAVNGGKGDGGASMHPLVGGSSGGVSQPGQPASKGDGAMGAGGSGALNKILSGV